MLIAILDPCFTNAQENGQDGFAVKFGGFIKNDFFYDSRQTVAAREGHFMLWPAAPLYDLENRDTNEASSFNFLSIQTRLNAAISIPDAFGAKTSGMVEGAFFGHSNPDINGFRLRHAWVKFNWDNTELLFGQFWNPLFVTSNFPDVVSFNTGCPFQPFSRNPQVRLTQSLGDFRVIASALSQRDFANVGPWGASSSYLRNSTIPDLHAQVHYVHGGAGILTQFITGGGISYKKIVPELLTQQGYITDAGVTGITWMAFARAAFQPVTVKAQFIAGQNVTDLLMIGGYGISRIINPERGLVEYVPLQTTSYWIDMHTNGQTLQFGIFGAISENRGATDNLAEGTTVTGFGTNIKSTYRVSPRIIFNSGRARFALEGEYSAANFGTIDLVRNSKGIPVDVDQVANFRVLLGVYLFL